MQVRATDAMGFAISPVIPNRPIAHEVDRGRQRELLRRLLLGAVVVSAALFNGAQRFGILSRDFDLAATQEQRALEELRARHLLLERETLRAPARIEPLARQLDLVPPRPEDAVVLERLVPPPTPASSVVASR